jgi:hypothetical protein
LKHPLANHTQGIWHMLTLKPLFLTLQQLPFQWLINCLPVLPVSSTWRTQLIFWILIVGEKNEFHNSNWALVTHFLPDDKNDDIIKVDLLDCNHNITFNCIVFSEIVLNIPSPMHPTWKAIITLKMQTVILNYSLYIRLMWVLVPCHCSYFLLYHVVF